MQEILISVGVPIITALISFLGARLQANKELEKAKEQNKIEIEKVQRQTQAELEKIKLQTEKEIEKVERRIAAETKQYEQNAQTDAIANMFSNPKMTEIIMKEAMKEIGKS